MENVLLRELAIRRFVALFRDPIGQVLEGEDRKVVVVAVHRSGARLVRRLTA